MPPPSDFRRAVHWGCGLYIGWFLASCCVLFSLWLLFFGGCVVLFGTGAAILSTQSHDTSLPPPPPLDRPRIPEPPALPPVPPPHRPAHYVRSDLADGLRTTHVVRAIEPPEADDAERRRLARAIADAERLDSVTVHFFRARDAVDEWNGDAELRPLDATRLRGTVEVRGNQALSVPIAAAPAVEEPPAVPKPQAAPEPPPLGPDPKDEQRAADKLRLAKKMRSEGNISTGNRWLRELVDKFPDTQAAAEARQLLGLPARRISN